MVPPPTSATAIVFSGGDPPHPHVARWLPDEALVVAADSGLDHARALRRSVDLVVGDLDSVSDEALAEARGHDTPVEAHSADKDLTDLDLALRAAVQRGARHLIVVGGRGGRWDHELGNLLLIAGPPYAHCTLDLFDGESRVHVVHGGRGPRELPGATGEQCSLLAMHGTAEGVETDGLRWRLAGEDLAAGSTRGLSNVVDGDTVRVALARGTVVVVFP